MDNIVEIVKKSLKPRERVTEEILESTPIFVKRAIIKLQRDGIIPPKIKEYDAEAAKEERRDGNNNLMYNFIFLPKDFRKLDKLVVHKKLGEEENRDESPYQHVSNESFFNRRRDSDDRNFFSILDYNLDDEQQRKILVADPFFADDDWIELHYKVDGTEENLNNYGERYWEAIIATVESMLGLRSKRDAEDEVLDESEAWRNQEGENTFNKTFKRTKVRFPFGKN